MRCGVLRGDERTGDSEEVAVERRLESLPIQDDVTDCSARGTGTEYENGSAVLASPLQVMRPGAFWLPFACQRPSACALA